MTTEEYSIGYDAGYQDGFNEALEEPCNSPYCECDVGKCSRTGYYDNRHGPDYKVLWEQMCKRCDELDAQLAKYSEGEVIEPLYTGPVEREWVDLTDDEEYELAKQSAGGGSHRWYRLQGEE